MGVGRRQFVAAMMLHCPEPADVKTEPATYAWTISVYSNRDSPLDQVHSAIAVMNSALYYIACMPRHIIPNFHRAQEDHQRWAPATDTLDAICCSHDVASP